ncbi:MAG: formate dehydrogenase accessory sulfurtransferase FdhD [Paracoccaceae bacterium]
MTEASRPALRRAFRAGRWESGARAVPAEVPVALVYNGTTQAVMMATPADLEDFAAGFSLTEGIVGDLSEIRELDKADGENGIELRLWLAPEAEARFAARRRAQVGPVGCGLCGIDSLAEALRPLPTVAGALRLSPRDVAAAMAGLTHAQPLNLATRAVHAAGFWQPGRGVTVTREDVGRHNALDKLAGALARAGTDAAAGALVLTSRLSVDMVQKAAMIGAPVLLAASAPTALAIETAEAVGLTLVAVVRGEDFEVFTHPRRIAESPASESAEDVA